MYGEETRSSIRNRGTGEWDARKGRTQGRQPDPLLSTLSHGERRIPSETNVDLITSVVRG